MVPFSVKEIHNVSENLRLSFCLLFRGKLSLTFESQLLPVSANRNDLLGIKTTPLGLSSFQPLNVST